MRTRWLPKRVPVTWRPAAVPDNAARVVRFSMRLFNGRGKQVNEIATGWLHYGDPDWLIRQGELWIHTTKMAEAMNRRL